MKKLHHTANRSGSQVRLGALLSYLSLGINIITGLLYTPWMVRQIGQANYGLYTLSTSLIAFFMMDFGLGSAVARFIAKYRAEGNQPAVDRTIGTIYKLYLLIDLVILCILSGLYFFLDRIYTNLTPSELEVFRTLYLMVAAFNLISFPLSPLNGILNAYEKFIQLKLCDLFHKLFTVALVVSALSFSASVKTVVAANIVSGLFTLLLKLILVKKQLPLKPNFKARDRETYKGLFSFTLWVTVESLMQRLTHSLSPSVLGMTASSIEIAVYSPAVVIEGYFYNIATAINGLFLPRISRHIADKQEDEILKLMIKVGRYQIIVLGLIFVGFICVGQEFMTLWMGPDYAKSYFCVLILFLPSMISYPQQIASTTVVAKNLISYKAKFALITGTAGLVISYVLSSLVGSIGVCIGTAVTSLSNTIYMNYIYQAKAGIQIGSFYKHCWVKAIPCFAFVIILGLLTLPMIPVSGWAGLFIKAACLSIVYFCVFFFVYLPSGSRAEMLRLLKRKK